MAQLSGTLVQQEFTTNVKSRTVALAAVYGFGFVYLASLVVAVWVAYDGGEALTRFFVLTSGVLLLMAAPLLSTLPISLIVTLAMIVPSLVALATAVLYISPRIAALAIYLPAMLSDNLASGVLVIALPFACAALWVAAVSRRFMLGGFAVLGLVSGAVALVLTGSRGAWIGLSAGAMVAGYLLFRHAFVARRDRRPLWLLLVDASVIVAVVGAVAFFVAIVLSPELDARLGVSAQGGSAFSRIALWRDSLPLIQDYFFTGSGLSATAMIYATYAYLLHVPYLVHAHNLYLQIALEQGVLGLVAFLGIMTSAVAYTITAWRRTDAVGRVLLAAGYAALTALLVHGLFDAELFYSLLAPMIFLAPALLVLVASGMYRHARSSDYGEPVTAGRMAGVVMGIGLPVLVAVILPGAPARWEANLGSALQSRTELSIYHRPEWSFQDEVRRRLPQDLAAAESHFQNALALDPAQPTANRRLGQIALARGNYAAALNYLSIAHAAQPGDRVARQLLGELAALRGDTTGAAAMWHGLDFSQGQLMVRGWWYEFFGEQIQHERFLHAVQAFERAQ